MKSYRLLTIALLLIVLVLPMTMPRPAHACTGGGWDVGYRERISQLYRADYISAVTLATITRMETLIPPNGPPSGPAVPIAIGSYGTSAVFQPQVLWSSAPLAGNTIGRLGELGPDCSGGPLFEPGDKVVLFLRTSRYPIADFSVSAFSETILFRGESAFFLGWNNIEPAGTTEEVLSYLLSVAKSPETTTGPARAFLGLPPAY